MIVDTGVIFALADRNEPRHADVRRLFMRTEPRLVPEPVVVEADWLIGARLGPEAEAAFLRSVSEELAVECPTRADRGRAAELVERYRDARIGYVDAVIVAMAERLGETTIATLDRRGFTVIRPAHVDAFELVP